MQKNKLLIWLGAIALALACLPTSSVSLPTAEPGAVNTYIVQTADAAATQTAAVAPAPVTPSSTAKPTFTVTLSPSPTITFVFILPGLGVSGTPTLPGIASGTDKSQYGCKVFSVEPADGTVYETREDFSVKWGVKNIGRETWYRATMDYVYYSGAKLHKVASYNLPKGAEPGKNVYLSADMETLKESGTFTTKWALKIDNLYFCPMTLTVIVN